MLETLVPKLSVCDFQLSTKKKNLTTSPIDTSVFVDISSARRCPSSPIDCKLLGPSFTRIARTYTSEQTHLLGFAVEVV